MEVVIEGRRYNTNLVVGNTWLVKRFHKQTTTDDESNYDEQELQSDSNDAVEVTKQAILNDSWS